MFAASRADLLHPPRLHHSHNRHGIQGLVQQYGQKHSHSRDPCGCRRTKHDRAKGHAINEGMDPQPQRDTHPTELVRTILIVRVAVVVVGALFVAEIMLVKMKQP